MNAINKEVANTADREIVISRDLDFPRDLVWEAFTNPRHVPRWWGPNGFTTTTHEMDVKPGGVWRFIMHGPDGTNYPNKIVYTEIVPPARIAYEHSGDEDSDNHYFHVIATLEVVGGKTRLTMRLLFETAEACEKTKEFGAVEGGRQTLGRLADYLKKIA